MNPWEKYAAPAAPAVAPAPSPVPEAGPWSAYGSGADEKSPPPATELHTYSTRGPKGKVITFQGPADASDDDIRRLAMQATGSRLYARSAIKRDGTPLPETDTSALSGFVAGALKPVDKAASWIAATPVGKAIDSAGAAIGLPTTAEGNAEHADWRANNTRTGYQTLGEIAGTLPLSRLPGGMATQGAASGALLSDSDNTAGTLFDAATGAVGSVVGGKIAQGIGSLATGVKDQGLRALNAAGVPLTLGQIAAAGKGVISKAVSKGEEALTSVPLIGDMINVARDRGSQGLNLALGNRILANIGEKLKPGMAAGHDMVDAVQSKLSARYAKLVPNLRGQADAQFNTDLTAAEAIANNAGRKDQLVGVATRLFKNRFNGTAITGQQLKDAESELTRLYSKYKNAQGDEGVYGEAIDGVRQALRGLVMRSNPQQAAELQGLNTGWAQLKALRAASQSAGNNADGVVTPASALRAFAKDGYRDRFLETAKQVLPNRTPDSGTARRGAMTLGTLATGGGVGAATVSPLLAVPAAGSLLYTKAGQRALNATAFASRPAAVQALAAPLNKIGRYAPQLVTPLLVGSDQ